jgi:ABC-type Zn uptake system ZnuABC Zn-binding protein ZnuA
MPRLKVSFPVAGAGAVCLTALTAAILLTGCQREGQERIRVMASTTMLESIVREVGGDRVSVTAMIPADTGPESFVVGVKQVQAAARADLFIYCGWEEWAPRVTEAAEGPGHIARIDILGDLLLPYLHVDAVDSVTEALVRRDPDGEVFYRYNRNDYRSRIAAAVEDVCASVLDLQGAMVICAETQADFLNWMGLDIIGTYGRPEDLSSAEGTRLVEIGRKNGVRLVVDDLHSGEDTGSQIADAIGATRVVLTRYPARGSYIEVLRSSADALVSALD